METVEFYTNALDLDPENSKEYLIGRAELYFEDNKYLKALEDYEKLISMGVEDIKEDECYLTCLDFKDADKTILELTNTINDRETVDDYIQRAYLYELKEDYSKAFADISRAIELEPTNSELYTCRAELCLEIQKYDYTKAVENSSNSSLCLHDRAEFYTKNGEYELAEIDYTKAIEVEESEYTYSARAGFYQGIECYEEALKDYNKALDLCPEYTTSIDTIEDLYIGKAGYYHDRAECYQGMGKYDLAIADYNKTLELIENSNISQEEKEYEISHVKEHIEECK